MVTSGIREKFILPEYQYLLAEISLLLLRLQHAFKKTRCYPWNYLSPGSNLAPLCTRELILDFEQALTSEHLNSTFCECPVACHSLRFLSSVDSVYLDPVAECQDPEMRSFATDALTSKPADEFFWI